mgnify:CR=1 FL=1
MAINWEVILWTCITLAVLMGVIGLILYAISAKNVRSKRKELGEVHTGLKVGSHIMFAGGVYGKAVFCDGGRKGSVGAGNSLGRRRGRPLDVRVRRRGKGFFRFLA